MGEVLVAIHQPNFFPWLGFFDKIARSDVFVLLDHVQLPRTGSGSWLNRVQLPMGGEARWLTAPVRKAPGLQPINESHFSGESWRRKAAAMLQMAYGRAPFFGEAMALVEPLLANPDDRLAEYNIHAVTALVSALGLGESKLVRSSSLALEGSSTDLLIAIVGEVGGDCYLAGGGAEGYQEDDKFESAGVGLRYQAFSHPIYSQHGNRGAFLPGLSVVDALMNLGVAGTARLFDGRAAA
jgi:hypothetical protein